MAITLISGLPGTGKTLSAIKRFLLPALSQKRKVYTNIDGINYLKIGIYLERVTKTQIELCDLEKILVHTEKFSTKMLIDGVDSNSMVIIDEAQVFWNNRDYNSEENKSLLPFLQKHRHYGLDIIFLTQNIDQLDIGIRRLCQVHYRLNRLSNLGFDKSIKVKVFPDAMGSEQFKPLATLIWKIDREIFSFYDSYQGAETKEAKGNNYNVFLRSPFFLFVVFVFFVCVAMILRTANKGFASSLVGGVSAKEKDFSSFDLGEYDEYYCGDKFYVLRPNGKVDTLSPKTIPPTYCPHINFNFKRAGR
ncbi:MAG: zonular occludens toxin domain-containing protein [Fibromonadaceae bacterium]|jgi:zona occludens toxin (predicted ATPase)|nr:zonular occludens toxin domain-containing protein [Fibromonadaceae bacterium]